MLPCGTPEITGNKLEKQLLIATFDVATYLLRVF